MSFADEAELMAFLGGDHLLPNVTAESVEIALIGFDMPLGKMRDHDWLAMAVRRSLARSMQNIEDGPSRTSNADVRAELERLSALAQSTWAEMFNCKGAVEHRLWRFALGRWDGEGGTEIEDGLVIGDPAEMVRFTAATHELEWLSGFLRDAGRSVEAQCGPWRQSEEREVRIERGQWLAPIYEAAFGASVSANNWPSGAHKKPSAFMDFYQRMVALAFGEQATPNISGVLKEACRRHRSQPAQFVEGIIPGL